MSSTTFGYSTYKTPQDIVKTNNNTTAPFDSLDNSRHNNVMDPLNTSGTSYKNDPLNNSGTSDLSSSNTSHFLTGKRNEDLHGTVYGDPVEKIKKIQNNTQQIKNTMNTQQNTKNTQQPQDTMKTQQDTMKTQQDTMKTQQPQNTKNTQQDTMNTQQIKNTINTQQPQNTLTRTTTIKTSKTPMKGPDRSSKFRNKSLVLNPNDFTKHEGVTSTVSGRPVRYLDYKTFGSKGFENNY
jgi:hypothetical protein